MILLIVLNKSRQQAYQAVNTSMLFAYCSIGQLIVENEQDGNKNANYGKAALENLSKKLSKEFGAGFTIMKKQDNGILRKV